MSDISAPADAELRQLARTASIVTMLAGLIVALSFLAALDTLALIEPGARALQSGDWPLLGETFRRFAARIVPLIPVGFYLLAVLGALAILDRIGKGEYFTAPNIRALADMGGAMLWGAGWAALFVPLLTQWLASRAGGFPLDLTPENLVIATIGLALLVIGRLFLRARKLETEMEAIV